MSLKKLKKIILKKMDNNQRNNTDIVNLNKSKHYLNLFINVFYNLRNHFYLLLKDFYCNEKKGIEYNFNKINGILKSIEKITLQYKSFYENTIQKSPNFTIQKEDISNFFKGEQIFNNTILISFSGFWKLLNFGNVYIVLFKEISKKKFSNYIEYIHYDFQIKYKENQKRLKKEKDETWYNEININNDNLILKESIKEYFKDTMTIEFLNSNPNDKYTKILISIKNLFNIVLYYDSKNIKIVLGGKKEHYSFHNNKFSFLESKKIHKIDNAKSKFLIYKKLKKILLEKFKVQNKISRPFYFCKIISIYSKIFKEKCIICNKIVKFNSIDKNFYPPLIYDNENSNYNEKINCFHEECYSIFINE